MPSISRRADHHRRPSAYVVAPAIAGVACLLLAGGCQWAGRRDAGTAPQPETAPVPVVETPETTADEAPTPPPPPAQKKIFGGSSLPEIAEELIAMGDQDQRLRQKLLDGGMDNPDPQLVRAMIVADNEHTIRLKQIIKQFGWPGRSLVGEKASKSAWLIAQHSDQDPAFQAQVLELIRPLVATGEVDGSNYALLTDRVRVAQGRPQLYGTQYQIVRRGGQLLFGPSTAIEDPANLDARRAQIGLGPHAEYVERLRQMYISRIDNATPAQP